MNNEITELVSIKNPYNIQVTYESIDKEKGFYCNNFVWGIYAGIFFNGYKGHVYYDFEFNYLPILVNNERNPALSKLLSMNHGKSILSGKIFDGDLSFVISKVVIVDEESILSM